MPDNADKTTEAIAVLDHFEAGGGNEYAEFDVIDPETGDTVGGVHPYINAEELPESAGRTDVFRITYDAETDEQLTEISHAEYLADETQTQNALNAKRLIQLQDEGVISTTDESEEEEANTHEHSSDESRQP